MWTNVGLTLLFIGAFYCKAQSTSLVKRQISSEDAICNDKTRAIFYIRLSQTTRKWLIFFESGGLCSSKDDCNKRYSKDDSKVLMSSTGMPEKIEGWDMLSNDRHANPDFYNFNHVLVPYCSSDLWLGSRTNPANFSFVDDSEVNNFSFRGHTIFTSVISDLMNYFNLSQSEVVILSGSSAGAIGVLNHASWFADDFVQKNNLSVQVLAIIDSGWFINFQESIVSGFKIKGDFIQMTNVSSMSGCADLSYGFPCCMSASCMLSRGYFPEHLPVMFVFSLYDVYMLSKVIKKFAEKNDLKEKAGDLVSLVNMYGGAMRESLDSTRLAKMSYFVPACFQHVYFSTSSLWDKEGGVLNSEIDVSRGTAKFSHKVQSGIWEEIKVPSQNETGNLRSAITRWMADTASPIRIVDSCLGAHCNPTCPDKLVFFDPAKEWSSVVKYTVLGLSLLATVVCVALKLIFMIYLVYVTGQQRSYNQKCVESKKRKEFPPCKSDESVSIACLSLTYHVITQKNYAKEKVTGTENMQEEYLKDEGNENEGEEGVSDSFSSSSLSEDADDERDVEQILDPVLSFQSISDETNEPVRSPTRKQSSSTRNDQETDLLVTKSTENLKTGSRAVLVEGDQEIGKIKWLKSRRKNSTDRKKQILNGVSSYFNPGELVAIMGPSGCGKTTLLDLLTGRRRTGERKGCVFINGVELKDVQEWYGKMVGYVLQLAVPFYEELTVRQNITFAAHMRLPRSMKNEEKFERIEQIIEETGLGPMANTVVGGHIGPGLSGGQKRRLCVALQMINMPPAIFLDEPTSGLDALSSLELLGHLNLVAESGRLVVLTIHQPRLEIFHLFHKILLLCEGQVAYYGDPSTAPKVFIQAYGQATSEEFRKSSIAPKIDAKNPADTIMDILGCKEARHAILDFYQESGEPDAVKEAITQHRKYSTFFKSISNLKSKRQSGDAGMFKRVFVLESRTALRQTLGQVLYFPLIFLTFGIIIGTVYYRAEEKNGILLMSGYCVYCCASPLFLSSVLMAHLNKALDVYRLEHQDGIGRSHENVIQTFVRVASLCSFPVILCSAMSYFMVMGGFDPWQFLILTVISLVLNQTWIAVYMMVICASPNIAHRICPMVSAIGGFAGGFLVPKPQMPIVYDLLFYINPQYYGYAAIAKVLLKDKLLGCKYDSTLNCRSNDGNAVLSNFGFDVVNPYEHLVIMLGMTATSLLLSWLFLEMRNWDFKSMFAKPADTTFYVEQEIEDVVVAPSEGLSMQLYPERPVSSPVGILARSASTRSTLGVIHGDKGHHAVRFSTPNKEKLIVNQVLFGSLEQPQAPSALQKAREAHAKTKRLSFSTEERRSRWQQHLEERKYNMEKEMREVKKIARRMSISQPFCTRRRHTFAVNKGNAIPSTSSTSKPVSRHTRPHTERRVSSSQPDRRAGSEASPDHVEVESGPGVSALSQRLRRRSEQTVSSLENINESGDNDEEDVFSRPTREPNQQQSSPRTPSDTDVITV